MSGPHGDLGAVVAVAGDFGQAKPLVERLRAAVDRQHIEDQVLAFALCFLQKRADDPAAEAMALMAGGDFDWRQKELPPTGLDHQQAHNGPPRRGGLPTRRGVSAGLENAPYP